MSFSGRCAGIDIGSRTIELVIIENEKVVYSHSVDSGFDPLAIASSLLQNVQFDHLIATGYGRHMLEISHDIETVTEIKAYAEGALAVLPGCRSVLDIGGQDVKAIAIGPNNRVQKFEMNERCAAGSGKFLEIMAYTLGYDLSTFGQHALNATGTVNISSMCTVFAESEVTSLLNKGVPRPDIALAVHHSVIKRAVSMLNRVSTVPQILFAGGGARNPCLGKLIEESLASPVYIPQDPHMLGALGAARIASSRIS